MKSRIHSNRGSALVFALVTVTVVASAGAAYLQFTTGISKTQSSTVQNTQAFYLAEAGLAEAFRGVRLGRTGNIGSLAAPAQFGNGLLWVKARDMPGNQIELTSTALAGTGRASLSYILEAQQPNLGIFSVEDMVIDQVIMVDGYNSEDGSYQEHIPTDMALPGPIPAAANAFLESLSPEGIPVGCHLGYHNWCTGSLAHSSLYTEASEAGPESLLDKVLNRERLLLGREGLLGGYQGTSQTPSQFESRNDGMLLEIRNWRDQLDGIYTSARIDAAALGETIPMRPPVGNHTAQDGILGTNGSVSFNLAEGQIPEIYGEVNAGVGNAGAGAPQATISEGMSGQAASVELPKVVVPAIDSGLTMVTDPVTGLAIPSTEVGSVVHASPLPFTVPSGSSEYLNFTVKEDAEAIIRGPAVIVIGQMTLESGATLTLDTRLGNIELYVTAGMDLQPGSATITSEGQSTKLALQVAAIESNDGEAPINLDAASQFHGTIYSPETEVYVGSDFELYGRIMARKLQFGPGAKLHVDHAGMQGSSIPEIVSWKIIEVPAQVKTGGNNPMDILGVDDSVVTDLTSAHDLDHVMMEIQYVDKAGLTQSYTGLEGAFDWDQVASVDSAERVPDRSGGYFSGAMGVGSPSADAGIGMGETEPAPGGLGAAEDELADAGAEESEAAANEPDPEVRHGIAAAVDGAMRYGVSGMNGAIFAGLLSFSAPFSAKEWDLIAQTKAELDPEQYTKLVNKHLLEGGAPGDVR